MEIGVVASMGAWRDCEMVHVKVVPTVEKSVCGMGAS